MLPILLCASALAQDPAPTEPAPAEPAPLAVPGEPAPAPLAVPGEPVPEPAAADHEHPESIDSKEPIVIALGGPILGWGIYSDGNDFRSNFVLGLALGAEVASKSDIGYLAFARTHVNYVFGSQNHGWDWGLVAMGGPKLAVVSPIVGIDVTFSKKTYLDTDYHGAWTIGTPFGLALDLKYFFADYIYAPQWFIANRSGRDAVDWSTRSGLPGFGDELRTFARIGFDAVIFNSWIGAEGHTAAWGSNVTAYIGIGFGKRTSWSSIAN